MKDLTNCHKSNRVWQTKELRWTNKEVSKERSKYCGNQSCSFLNCSWNILNSNTCDDVEGWHDRKKVPNLSLWKAELINSNCEDWLHESLEDVAHRSRERSEQETRDTEKFPHVYFGFIWEMVSLSGCIRSLKCCANILEIFFFRRVLLINTRWKYFVNKDGNDDEDASEKIECEFISSELVQSRP